MPARTEIEDILRLEVEQAIKRHEEAKVHFRNMVAEIPSGLPQPDGTLRISKTSRELNTARDALIKAVEDFNRFLLDGVVPEEFRKKTLSHSG